MTVWTPPGFTYRQVRNVYSAATVADHFHGDVPDALGLILHVQDGDGGLFGWFDDPKSQASSAWWAGKKGEREQYGDPDLERFWTQKAGNWTYHAVETEGTPDEPLTDAQVETVAQILAAGHERYGWELQDINVPGESGLGWHGMGALNGVDWGHPYCPGDIRRAQMPDIVARAREIAGEKDHPVYLTACGYPALESFPVSFAAPNGDFVDVADNAFAIVMARFLWRLDTEVSSITSAFGGRTIAQQIETYRQLGLPPAMTSNHLAGYAVDAGNGRQVFEPNQRGAYSTGYTPAQERQIRVILGSDEFGGILQWGADFNSPYRDPVHWQLRQAKPYGAGPYPKVVQHHELTAVAKRIRDSVKAIQRATNCPDDGIAGPSTIAAVKGFQKAHGLTVDGIVGPATEAALFAKPKRVVPDRADRSTDRKPIKPKHRKPKHDRLTVDGVAGKSTIKELQRQLRTPVDGAISSQPRRYRTELRAWTTVRYAHGKASGSALVRALQEKIGAEPDAIFGPATAGHLQRWLRKHGGAGIDVDGIPGPQTVKALQRALNREDFH